MKKIGFCWLSLCLCLFISINVIAEINSSESSSLDNGGCNKLCTSSGRDSYGNVVTIRTPSQYADARETYPGSNKYVCISCDCGNGVVDLSDNNYQNTCPNNNCGNPNKPEDYSEECDDGNNVGFDGCTADCKREYCGDGIKNAPGEKCDVGSQNGLVGSSCSTTCKTDLCLGTPENVTLLCGNGVKECNEVCDAGVNNGLPNSGCGKDCIVDQCLEPEEKRLLLCGNETIDCDEQCDKGTNNGKPGSVCSNKCKVDLCLDTEEKRLTLCGNSTIDCDEQCDKGSNNGKPGSGCSNKCKVDLCLDTEEKRLTLCGNGIKDCDEQCDAGANNGKPGSSCSNKCKVDICLDVPENRVQLCGNGIKDCDEQCDDGNKIDGDGCSKTCKLDDICEGVVRPTAHNTSGYGAIKDVCLKGRFDSTGTEYTYSIVYNELDSVKVDGYESGVDYKGQFNEMANAADYRRRRNFYLYTGVTYLYSKLDPTKVCYTCAYIRTGGCFAPETLIQLANGSEITVADLHAGDEIINPTTKKVAKVKSFIESYENKPLVEISYLGKTLRVTDGHPMVTAAGIIKASKIKVGDLLFDAAGKPVVVENVKLSELDSSQRVINLVIESEDPSIANHILVSEGVQTGDYIAQQMIAKD